jgi:tetratricopeptide (TPR) repeat protein
VVGKDVPLGLLAALLGQPEENLREALTRLQGSEFLYESSLFPELEYTFKHALTHEVAYGGMLLDRRRALHATMVDAIEARYGDRLSEHAERLAHHAFRGEVWDKAAQYSRQAGDRAAALCVDTEAVGHYQRVLDALSHVRETRESVHAAIDVRLALRAPLWRGGQLEYLLAIFRDVEALGTRHGVTERLDEVYSFLLQYHWAKGEHERAIPYGTRCIDAGRDRGNLGVEITGRYYLGGCYQAQGQFDKALEHYGTIIATLQGALETERFGLSGLPYSGAAAQAAYCLLERGQITRAADMLKDADRVANAVNHLYSKVPVAVVRGLLLLQVGGVADVINLLEPVVALCRENKFAGQTMRALTVLAQGYLAVGRPDDAVPLAQEAIGLQEAAGAFVDRAYWLRVLAEAYRQTGRLDDAEITARTALDFSQRNGERAHEAWIRALLGDIAADKAEYDRAFSELGKARRMAIELRMRLLEASCRLRLGTVARRLGRLDDARDHLSAAGSMLRDIGAHVPLVHAESELRALDGGGAPHGPTPWTGTRPYQD